MFFSCLFACFLFTVVLIILHKKWKLNIQRWESGCYYRSYDGIAHSPPQWYFIKIIDTESC